MLCSIQKEGTAISHAAPPPSSYAYMEHGHWHQCGQSLMTMTLTTLLYIQWQ